jgi:hypothetical protein
MCRERASVTRRSATAGQSYPATKLVFILIYVQFLVQILAALRAPVFIA